MYKSDLNNILPEFILTKFMEFYTMNVILGIDIAKSKFDVALLIDDKIKHKEYPNNHSGFTALKKWLSLKGVSKIHACMEATGVYGEALAHYLYSLGHDVSIVNPMKIKGFAQSSLSRNKTDKADAKIIAQFCAVLSPQVWHPELEHVKYLQELVKRYDDLVAIQQQEKNRLDSASVSVLQNIKEVINHLHAQVDKVKKQITDLINKNPDLKNKKNLLDTIPGIGENTIAKILAFIGDTSRFDSAKHLAAFVGLSPKNRQSGSSIHGKTQLCKAGNKVLRRALYFPAIVAKKHNPIIKDFCERLAANNKSTMAIICAAMRKLVHIIYGVLKSGLPFNENLAISNQ